MAFVKPWAIHHFVGKASGSSIDTLLFDPSVLACQRLVGESLACATDYLADASTNNPSKDNVYSISEFENAPKHCAKAKKILCIEAQIHNKFNALCDNEREEYLMGIGVEVSDCQPGLIKSKTRNREGDSCLVVGEVVITLFGGLATKQGNVGEISSDGDKIPSARMLNRRRKKERSGYVKIKETQKKYT